MTGHMTRTMRSRLRWALAAGVALVVLVSTMVWAANRPPLHGDIAWQVPAAELGFSYGRVEVAAAAGDLVALQDDERAVVVDHRGRAVLTDLPTGVKTLREDGSGWAVRADEAIVAWDADGAETTIVDATIEQDLLAEVGVESLDRPDLTLVARTDDVAVLGGCRSREDGVSVLLALDTRSGEVVWDRQRRGSATPSASAPPRRRARPSSTGPSHANQP